MKDLDIRDDPDAQDIDPAMSQRIDRARIIVGFLTFNILSYLFILIACDSISRDLVIQKNADNVKRKMQF